MTVSVKELIADFVPEQTVLILGAGASIPSGAPSTDELIKLISQKFQIDCSNLSLGEVAGLAEQKRNRRELLTIVRTRFSSLKAKGALLNVPLYEWKAIFSTNYDELVEDAYSRAGKSLQVFSSNFDYSGQSLLATGRLFKIHGTISKDISDGNAARIVITDVDNDDTSEYREALFDRLKSDIAPGTRVLILGQSLADKDLRDIVQRAIVINQKAYSGGNISLLLYSKDENRATLLESRGVKVAFGGLDELMTALADRAPSNARGRGESDDVLSDLPLLRATSRRVADELQGAKADASSIFNGWPADYGDISRGYTFQRQVAIEIAECLSEGKKWVALMLGASGVGKTTAARQAMLALQGRGFPCYEHKSAQPLSAPAWLSTARALSEKGQTGVLMVDEAHTQLYEVNQLIDALTADHLTSLRLLLISTRNHWGPRVKTPAIYVAGREWVLSRLNSKEIDNLLLLVDRVSEIRNLVETGFSGFSHYERRRRLVERCEADMFVCMRNIFASEKYDDIILREYATLDGTSQEVYRYVAAMENAGVQIHRQLVIRTLGIQASSIPVVLAHLEDIISEYDVNSNEGIYGWRVRHNVIASIIARYKFFETESLVALFLKVIDNVSPTFEIEIRTFRELCNSDGGISALPDKGIQNTLLRRMMSVAPGERIPRHRLIRNLIDLGEFEKAEAEIRIYEKDFGREAPVARYRILLMLARAEETPGLLREDRIVILEEARKLTSAAVARYSANKYVLGAFCELGIVFVKLAGKFEVFDEALAVFRKAESQLGDPDVTKMIARYQRRVAGHVPGAEAEPSFNG